MSKSVRNRRTGKEALHTRVVALKPREIDDTPKPHAPCKTCGHNACQGLCHQYDEGHSIWEEYVPEDVLLKWKRPCEEMFVYLAEHSPEDLLVLSYWLMPSQLTFAAEYLGLCKTTVGVEARLIYLLEHSSPMVREGALIGLDLLDADCRNWKTIENIRDNDSSPAVRSIAAEILENC